MDLRSISLFSALETRELEELGSHVHSHTYPKGTQIITEGDDPECLFFVFSGRVKVFLSNDKGKELVMNIHQPGDFFGEVGVLERMPRTASVLALDRTRLGIMSGENFERWLSGNPRTALRLVYDLAHRLRQATDHVRRLSMMDVYGRLAVTIMNLSEEENGERVVRERITQQKLADHIGASREMVSRIMKDLRAGDYIDIEHGHLHIKKPLPPRW